MKIEDTKTGKKVTIPDEEWYEVMPPDEFYTNTKFPCPIEHIEYNKSKNMYATKEWEQSVTQLRWEHNYETKEHIIEYKEV
jgi:hypothetical protein